ncbi:hypothetical protein [Cupriavidus sp. SK-4]|uniref:hypothetical protein n=1 Tax=Cupriavidus sp. SK-4 TaxID=574750 RepID=UPI000AE10A0D|nr:hypothetical protein [Cupriavidus sp. SK-4]
MNRQRSIAARLAAMFGLAAALVFTITGMVLYRVQCVELEKRQLGEIRARFDLAGTKAAGLGTEKQWEHFAAMLRTLTPADHSVRYFVESTDPRFDYGEPFPREADTSPRAPDVWAVEFGDNRFLMLKRRIPALNDRPEVALAVAVDQAAFFETSRTLGIALVVSSVLGVIAVSLLGWRIAKSGLAPIERLSQHAGALDPKQLERLPDADLPA